MFCLLLLCSLCCGSFQSSCTDNCWFLFDNVQGSITSDYTLDLPSGKTIGGVVIIVFNGNPISTSTVQFAKDGSTSPLAIEYTAAGTASVFASESGKKIAVKRVPLQSLESRGTIEIRDKFSKTPQGYFEINTVHYFYGDRTKWNKYNNLNTISQIKVTNPKNVRYIRVCNKIKPKICSVRTTPALPQLNKELSVTCTISGAPRGVDITWEQFKNLEPDYIGYPSSTQSHDDADKEYITTSVIRFPAFNKHLTGIFQCGINANIRYGYSDSYKSVSVEFVEIISTTDSSGITIKAMGWKVKNVNVKCGNMHILEEMKVSIATDLCFGNMYSVGDLDCSWQVKTFRIRGVKLNNKKGKMSGGHCNITNKVDSSMLLAQLSVSQLSDENDDNGNLTNILIGVGCGVLCVMFFARIKKLATVRASAPATIVFANRAVRVPAPAPKRPAVPHSKPVPPKRPAAPKRPELAQPRAAPQRPPVPPSQLQNPYVTKNTKPLGPKI